MTHKQRAILLVAMRRAIAAADKMNTAVLVDAIGAETIAGIADDLRFALDLMSSSVRPTGKTLALEDI